MKLNKSKNKGKVHPSPSSSSSSQTLFSSTQPDPVSTLNNLLPTAILTLISILSLQDKQVLAYMITHSLSSSSSSSSSSSFFASKTTASSSSSSSSSSAVDKKSKKGNNHNNNNSKRIVSTHKIPSYECGCFDCYTSYWFRWDSSPNRELIHQAIEAFEEHLSDSELPKTTPNKSSRRRESHSKVKKFVDPSLSTPPPVEKDSPECTAKDDDVAEDESGGSQEEEENKKLVQQPQQQQQHKWLARKVLPDVIGLFNSRLWNLWGPNV